MTAQTIEKTAAVWSQEPQKALGKPSVKARSEGTQAVVQAGNFTWRADLPEALGGANKAPSPTALMLSALAGCAVVFIKDTLAPQLGIRVYGVEATVTCETDSRGLLGIDGVEPDLRNLRLDLRIESTDGEAAVQRLLDVWKERCPIYLALQKPVDVTVRAQVVNWYADGR